jgi:calcineurin-like phosphoesterase family protein
MQIRIHFTSDLHWGHKLMTNLRGFGEGEEACRTMDQTIVDAINATVEPKDDLWILGDISFRGKTATVDLLDQIQCENLHLVVGNHDGKQVRKLERWATVQTYTELRISDTLFCLSHYPFCTWNNDHRGSLMLHGHYHGDGPETNLRRFDIGVDTVPLRGFKPYSAEELLIAAESRVLPSYRH